MRYVIIALCILFFSSCSVDFSLVENRRCDNEGKCIAGYVCDRATMTCVKPGTIADVNQNYTDTSTDTTTLSDTYIIEDVITDTTCIPTNNGVEICDGIDNNCDGKTDEDKVCGICTIVDTITEKCDESTNCNTCFIVNGIKYICISNNGSNFEWTKESDIECNSSMNNKIIRCENRCFLCKDGKYEEPFFMQNESCDGKDNNCNGVIDEGEICQPYMICENGKCVEKPCSKNEDCPQGKICKNNSCSNCVDITDDSLCGTGKICINNSCIDGDCHQDTDCFAGICINNKCCADCCREKKDCPEEKICKQQKCSECTDFIEDLSCGLGYICEDKKCIKGNCHPSVGCLFGKICVNYNCCDPGPTCCNEDKNCKSNMTCTSAHACECKQLFGDCNNNYDDGCETNLSNDKNNCGVCNQKCSLPNADPECISGQCKIKNCKPGFNNCDNKDNNGCESDPEKDKLNCGDCGVVCSADNATVKCENSKCVIASCNAGFADCNNDYTDGCETDVYNQDNNCGDCKKICPTNKTVLNENLNKKKYDE